MLIVLEIFAPSSFDASFLLSKTSTCTNRLLYRFIDIASAVPILEQIFLPSVSQCPLFMIIGATTIPKVDLRGPFVVICKACPPNLFIVFHIKPAIDCCEICEKQTQITASSLSVRGAKVSTTRDVTIISILKRETHWRIFASCLHVYSKERFLRSSSNKYDTAFLIRIAYILPNDFVRCRTRLVKCYAQ